MGSCGVDYLASVAAFPKPDEKLRTDRLEVQGGGNAANALTAAARLGLQPLLVSKIGGDGLGDSILEELEGEGIDTSQVLRAAGSPSPFTYIIVDRQGGTRTCIHTPGEAFAPEEVTEQLRQHSLQDARLVYFDGRLTEAALLLAAAARAAGVPVLVEAERLRPGLDQLLQLADCVVTSATFPQAWTGEPLLSDALLASAQRLPRARFLLTTLGSAGSVMLVPQPDGAVGSSTGNRAGRANDDDVRAHPCTAVPCASVRVGVLADHRVECVTPALQDAVVDTTGAGDAFIGSVLYALAHGLPLPKMMQLASLVAASKCTQLGARPGLPHCSSIAPDLLS
ncbi:PfkB-type carbohydrate kinase [Haematococcus lacustris]